MFCLKRDFETLEVQGAWLVEFMKKQCEKITQMLQDHNCLCFHEAETTQRDKVA